VWLGHKWQGHKRLSHKRLWFLGVVPEEKNVSFGHPTGPVG
jgi:hypothetical protein